MEYRDKVNQAIWKLVCMGVRFTAEDVREFSGEPPHQNALGGLIFGAVKAGIIERVDWAKAKRRASHARNIQVYKGTRLVLEEK